MTLVPIHGLRVLLWLLAVLAVLSVYATPTVQAPLQRKLSLVSYNSAIQFDLAALLMDAAPWSDLTTLPCNDCLNSTRVHGMKGGQSVLTINGNIPKDVKQIKITNRSREWGYGSPSKMLGASCNASKREQQSRLVGTVTATARRENATQVREAGQPSRSASFVEQIAVSLNMLVLGTQNKNSLHSHTMIEPKRHPRTLVPVSFVFSTSFGCRGAPGLQQNSLITSLRDVLPKDEA